MHQLFSRGPEELRSPHQLNDWSLAKYSAWLDKAAGKDVWTVIQCNGNRREDYHYVDHGPNAGKQPAFGPPHWVSGAIGCATWSWWAATWSWSCGAWRW